MNFTSFKAVFKSSTLSATFLSTFFFIIYATHSITRHLQFESHALDLGLFTQSIYLYTQDFSHYNTLKGMITLADHFDPILWTISPVYRIFPSPLTLLVIQSFSIASSAIPLFLIARRILKNNLLSLVLIFCYLSAPALFRANIFDFHPGTMLLLPVSLSLYAWQFSKYKLYILSFLMCFLFKEDTAVYFAGLGLYQIFNKQLRIGLFTLFSSIVLFALIKFFIMPFFWHTGSSGYLNTSTLPIYSPFELILLLIFKPSVISDIFFNSPLKAQTTDFLLKPFFYLPALSVFGWFTVFPMIVFRFSSSLTYLWGSEFHNNAQLFPFLLLSAIFSISRYKLLSKYLYGLAVFFLVTHNLTPGTPLFSTISGTYHIKDYSYIYSSVNSVISENVSVSAQTTIVPHFANREKIYLFPNISDANYVVLDTSLNKYPLTEAMYHKKLEELKKSKYWRLVKEEQTLLIFLRLRT